MVRTPVFRRPCYQPAAFKQYTGAENDEGAAPLDGRHGEIVEHGSGNRFKVNVCTRGKIAKGDDRNVATILAKIFPGLLWFAYRNVG